MKPQQYLPAIAIILTIVLAWRTLIAIGTGLLPYTALLAAALGFVAVPEGLRKSLSNRKSRVTLVVAIVVFGASYAARIRAIDSWNDPNWPRAWPYPDRLLMEAEDWLSDAGLFTVSGEDAHDCLVIAVSLITLAVGLVIGAIVALGRFGNQPQ